MLKLNYNWTDKTPLLLFLYNSYKFINVLYSFKLVFIVPYIVISCTESTMTF